MTNRWSVVALAIATLTLTAACASGSSAEDSPAAATTPAAGAASATAPRLLMTDPLHGFAVWPVGGQWAVLGTSLGWTQVVNASPPAVPTTGGLAVTVDGPHLVVGVLTTEQLTVSPYLSVGAAAVLGAGSNAVATGGGDVQWQPGQLPGALDPGREPIAMQGQRLTALVSGRTDTLVGADGSGWSTLTSARALDGTGRLRLDAITWATPQRGWLTGHAPRGSAIAFVTVDAGRTWAPVTRPGVPQASGQPGTPSPGGDGTDAALPPCGSGPVRFLPMVHRPLSGRASVTVEVSGDAGISWARSDTVPAPGGLVAFGCSGRTGWVLGAGAGAVGAQVDVTDDAGLSWRDGGAAPAGITDLAPVGGGRGFAVTATATGPQLWSVGGDGASFTPVVLPDWVAELGGGHS